MSDQHKTEVEEGSLAAIFQKYMENPCLPALSEAKEDGVREPLAKYIEEGGTLGPDTRAWLAQFLRGEAPKLKRGNKRSQNQIRADAKLLLDIQSLAENFGLTETGARKRYLDENEDLNDETIKSALKRAKNDPRVWALTLGMKRSDDEL